MGRRDLAAEYEQRYPGTGIPDAQKEERMERLVLKEERQSLRRTGRTRSTVIPRVPWHNKAGAR